MDRKLTVNKTTMLWENIPQATQDEMYAVARNWLLTGSIPYPTPGWLEVWHQTFGHTENQRMALRISIPARVFLSLLDAQLEKTKKLEDDNRDRELQETYGLNR